MSKPDPIIYRLQKWSITYDPKPWRAKQEEKFEAEIVYSAAIPKENVYGGTDYDHIGHTDKKSFTNMGDAQEWIDKELEGKEG